MLAKHLLLLDIDGLRPDVFTAALQAGKIPHIAQLLGGRELAHGLQLPVVAPFPSSTFCSQASLFTGAHPSEHGIPGNQYLDRFGRRPRRFGFDLGDILAADDAVHVFTRGLAASRLQTPTIYERFGELGYRSVVAGNMFASGATTWLKPSLGRMGLMMKGMGAIKVRPQDFDRHTVNQLIRHVRRNGLDNLITLYFLGADHLAHDHGPAAQADYLIDHIDPMIGRLWQEIQRHTSQPDEVFVAIFSDHGQIDVKKDQAHALRIGLPFREEMALLFNQIGRRPFRSVFDSLSKCDSFMGLNAGSCGLYLRHAAAPWSDAPRFQQDVLRVAEAFWENNDVGSYVPKLQDSLAAVLVRNVETGGWSAPFQALTSDGRLISLREWFAAQPADQYIDPVNRLQNSVGRLAPDVVLLPNFAAGFYFGEVHAGFHGGLHPHDSCATLAYGWPGSAPTQWKMAKSRISQAIAARCQRENNRLPSTADMAVGLEAFCQLPITVRWSHTPHVE